MSIHTPTHGVSNTIECSCGQVFSGPLADDVDDLFTAHKLGPKYEALMQVLFEFDEFDEDEDTTESMLEQMAERLEETGWRFTP